MAFGSSDFVYENVFDAITVVIEVNILQNDEVLNLETNLCIKNTLSKKSFKSPMRILW